MATMTELTQYLLAYRRPGGGPLCRMGFIQTTVPVWPPGLSISFQLRPEFNSYATIHYHIGFSPAMVPGTFNLEFYHSGVQIMAGVMGVSALAERNNTWIVITEALLGLQILTNISGVAQFCEATDWFLVVDTEDDLNDILDISRRWAGISPAQAVRR